MAMIRQPETFPERVREVRRQFQQCRKQKVTCSANQRNVTKVTAMKRSCVLFCVVALCLVLNLPLAASASPVGIITAIEGRADITRGEDPARPAAPGDEIHIGDFLRTLSKSRLELTFIDDSLTRLAPLSRLRVTEYLFDAGERTGTIDLLRGKVQSVLVKATPDSVYEIHTPTAVCGVRGTTFFVYYRDGVTGGASREGTFYVYSKGRPDQVRIVRPGQAFLVMGIDEIPIVRPATEEELERHLDDTTIREDEDLRDKEEFMNDGDVAGDAESGTRYADATDPDTELALLDPATEPMPEETIPTEPPLPEPIEPIEPIVPSPSPVIFSGMANGDWGTMYISLSSQTGAMSIDGEINSFLGGFNNDSWIVPFTGDTGEPLVSDTGGGELAGIFVGTTGSLWGVMPAFYLEDGVLTYILGVVEGEATDVEGDYDPVEGPAEFVTLATGVGSIALDLEEPEEVWKYESSLYTDPSYSAWGYTSVPALLDAEWGLWALALEGGIDGVGSWDIFLDILEVDGETEEWLTRGLFRGDTVTLNDYEAFENRITGSWIDFTDAMTGVLGGVIKGVIEVGVEFPYDYRWHAAAGGIALDTQTFLQMWESDKATLEALKIPFVDVGMTTLQCEAGLGNADWIWFTMNNVRFFAYSSGGSPLIWATGSVTGEYGGNPGGVVGDISGLDGGPPFEGAFSVTRWDGGNWAAEIYGEGTVTDIGDVSIAGGAAGSYSGVEGGALEGTASGVVLP